MSTGSAARILVVDDAASSRRALGTALEQAGLRVTEAANGTEALWRARECQFDLLVTDVHMPTMDGLQLLSELRKLSGYADIPVYILTLDASKERLERGRKLGATAWVIKPTDIAALVRSIGVTLADRQQRRAIPVF